MTLVNIKRKKIGIISGTMIFLIIYFVIFECAAGKDMPDSEREIERLRKELAHSKNNPNNIVVEYRLATLIRHRIDPQTQKYIVTDETRRIYEGIVSKYNHMDYYSADLPNHSRSKQIIVPESAVIAASYQKDKEKARQYHINAMECLNQTYLRRKKDWQTAQAPEKPSEDSPFGGPRETAKWESMMFRWQKRKQDAERGNVLHKFELGITKSAVKSYLLSYLSEYEDKNHPSSNQDIVRKAKMKIMKDFPDTPISNYASEYSNIIVDVLDRVHLLTK
jgi:hypothetical protein